MHARLKAALAIAALAIASQAVAQITFYEREGFEGRSFTTGQPIANFERFGFNDRASSVLVQSARWEVCEDAGYRGRCVVVRPGRYPNLAALGVNNRVSSVRAVGTNVRVDEQRYAPLPVRGQVTFFENQGFEGRSFSTTAPIANFKGSGFNDQASSVIVVGDRWEFCDNAGFSGRCVVLRPGRYASFAAMGLNDRVSSVRALDWNVRVDEHRYAPAPLPARVTFFERQGFEGRSFSATGPIANFKGSGFNDQASSVIVVGDRWEFCDNAGFSGRCVVLRPGRYASFAAMGLNDRVSSVRALDWNVRVDEHRYAPAPLPARVTFFERQGFEGRSFSATGPIANFKGSGFNDQASSVIVVGDRWEFCDNAGFSGRCVVLRPGRYASFAAMGLNDRVSSVRALDWSVHVDEQRYAPPPPAYAYYRRPDEQVFEAPVMAVRAVVGPPEQRCWVEREQVAVQPQSNVNVPGAIIGAVIGGVIGHQVGGGTGKDLATAGGAIAGAAIGANVNRDAGGQQVATQNVRHCTTVPSQAHPEYWDVTYEFRGQEHRVQMITPPGRTVTVNGNGEPRA